MLIEWQPPAEAEACDDIGAAQWTSDDTEEQTSIGSDMSDMRLTNSSQSSCGTCTDGMDVDKCRSMQEWLRLVKLFEARAKEAKQKEQDIAHQLYEARVYLLKKEKEVCNLQDQLVQEFEETRGLFDKIIEQDKKILYLQEYLHCSNIQAESRCGLNTFGSNVAKVVGDMTSSNLHTNPSPKACSPILPLVPNQDVTLNPRTTTSCSWKAVNQLTQNDIRWKAATAPSSPILYGRLPLTSH